MECFIEEKDNLIIRILIVFYVLLLLGFTRKGCLDTKENG